MEYYHYLLHLILEAQLLYNWGVCPSLTDALNHSGIFSFLCEIITQPFQLKSKTNIGFLKIYEMNK